ncbi:T9SS type A sorting domain-containing protein [Flavobacterium sp. MAH-1]|uniref:T9SS type A sorting domain-containing protein n=1 Tax=Flavobacterium agri TaxID=2743471 RepID=A0A7Y9C585_9FLAO|nr:choice-of-anchor L domain-containing protein [Flavobacterium agri]NUY80686.1 T9SS type A sorting domain-containing protein [Flavobacterium agri]NYA70710.1 T9SS type A sorting domain-containing protein [Flavobacterium agri]
MKKIYLFLLLIGSLAQAQFVETFDDNTVIPPAGNGPWTLPSGTWYVYDNGIGTNYWTLNSNYPALSGSHAAFMDRQNIGSGNLSKDYLVTPSFYVTPDAKLYFRASSAIAGYSNSKLQVWVAPGTADPTQASSFTTMLAEYNDDVLPLNPVYGQYEVTLPYPSGTAVYVAFVRTCTQTSGSQTGDRILLDDINNFSPVLSCHQPQNLTVTGVSPLNTSANVSWNEIGGATSWEILVVPATDSDPSDSDSGIEIFDNPHLITNLQANESYMIYLRSNCGNGLHSSWKSVGYTATPVYPPLVGDTSLYTIPQLVQSVLIDNPCLNISNITSSGSANYGGLPSIGYFYGGSGTQFPFESGIVLSTGAVSQISGPNTSSLGYSAGGWPGDPDLEALALATIGEPMFGKNASVLEFNFTSLAPQMSFNFVFASEEYGMFQCTFSDMFAFLLTDLQTGVTTNLAVVPGTNGLPVSVVTVRDGAYNAGCNSANPQFFGEYYGDGSSSLNAPINFNGMTEVMTASASLAVNHQYHLKLVIADKQDTLLDSAVFIEAGSFTQGPPQCSDKLELVAFVDENGNGVKDGVEQNFTYGSFAISQNAGPVQQVYVPDGEYSLYDDVPTNTYNLNYAIQNEFSGYYSFSGSGYTNQTIATGSGTQVLYFPIVLTNPYSDVSLTVSPGSLPRPGYTHSCQVFYHNNGVSMTSGTLDFTSDMLTTITSSTLAGANINSNTLTYNYIGLQPQETRSFMVNISVPDVPTVNLGDVLTHSASITASVTEINPANNSSSLSQVVVNSFDPNNIVEHHGPEIPIDTFSQNDYLYYTVNFQNLGTADAIHVKIDMDLDPQLDENSITILESSHDYVLQRNGTHLQWKFDYIMLSSNLANEAASKGFVTFRIKLDPGVTEGDMVPASANIFFDSNPAIQTNVFETTFTDALSSGDVIKTDARIYPNPASQNVFVSLSDAQIIQKINVYNILGAKVLEQDFGTSSAIFNVLGLSKGVYVIKILSENNMEFTKKLLIK